MYAYIPSRLGLPPTPNTPPPPPQEEGAASQETEGKCGARLQSPELLSAPGGWVAEVDMVLGEWLAKESCHVSWDGVPLC